MSLYKYEFPDPETASDGLVCYGGDLSCDMLLSAYYQGIFPWYSENDPILWWSPDPRFVLFPENIHVPKRLSRFMRHNESLSDRERFVFTMDAAFRSVINACSSVKRQGQNATWITPDMVEAYCAFHEAGFAHSFETWQDGNLVGGFYGVQLGSMFFGESMFTIVPEASKCAFVTFAEKFRLSGGHLIDSQLYTDNIARFGGKNISRSSFLRYEGMYLNESMEKDISLFY
ncbi:MAG: leucyl/phenylalanyl-tRNA--protein transferase [Treponemataceae bacterium]|nr:leucyl/phenylalanyl-tRNA--protein transferase [Treponemataceae bacterium]